MLLGDTDDMDDILTTVTKIKERSSELIVIIDIIATLAGVSERKD